jgi:hypothetical protein
VIFVEPATLDAKPVCHEMQVLYRIRYTDKMSLAVCIELELNHSFTLVELEEVSNELARTNLWLLD